MSVSVSQGSIPQEAVRITAWNTVFSYTSYAEAQTAVDRLVFNDFTPKELEIIGSGLRLVEQVTGRMSWSRMVASGAAGGAWIGLFITLLVGVFSSGAVWIGLIIGGLFIGAAWGDVWSGCSLVRHKPSQLLVSAQCGGYLV